MADTDRSGVMLSEREKLMAQIREIDARICELQAEKKTLQAKVLRLPRMAADTSKEKEDIQ